MIANRVYLNGRMLACPQCKSPDNVARVVADIVINEGKGVIPLVCQCGNRWHVEFDGRWVHIAATQHPPGERIQSGEPPKSTMSPITTWAVEVVGIERSDAHNHIGLVVKDVAPGQAVVGTVPAEPPQIGDEYVIDTTPPEPMPFDVALAFVRARIGCRSVEQRAAEALLRHIDATPHRPVEAWVADLRALSEDDRKEVFGAFCVHCGGDDPRCQCMNDE